MRPRSRAAKTLQAYVIASTQPDELTECWVWQRAIADGYGKMYVAASGTTRPAHRVSYESFVGPIPPGYHIDHICRNRACVNPAHLQAVTPSVNQLRKAAAIAGEPVCLNGHRQTEVTIIYVKGRPQCKTCRKPGTLT